jgi:hypothetical protein
MFKYGFITLLVIQKGTISGWDNILGIKGVKRPYWDCKCLFDEFSNPNPKCTYLTMEDCCYAKRRKQEDDDGGVDFFCSMSTYDIENALHDDHLPLSNNVHGPYKNDATGTTAYVR